MSTIETGKLADILAVRKDPLQIISTLSGAAFVMKKGTIHVQEGKPSAP